VAVMIQNYQLSIIDKLSCDQHGFIKNFIAKQKTNQVKKEIENIKNTLRLLNGTLGYALYNIDEENIKKIIKSLLKKDVIKSVYVFDSSTNRVFLSGYKEGNKTVVSKFLPIKYTGFPSISNEITYNGEKLGYIEVFYDMSEIMNELNNEEKKALKLVNKNFTQINVRLKKDQGVLYLYFMFATFLVTLVVVFVLFRLVNKPLSELKKGLKSFFDFLSNPSNSVTPIRINSQDEFGEIADFANNGIIISSKLHAELAELMKIVNQYVAIVEFNEHGKIINVTDAFCRVVGFSKEYLTDKSIDFFSLNPSVFEEVEKNGVFETEVHVFDKWLKSTFTKKQISLKNKTEYVWISYDVTPEKEVEFMKNNLEVMLDEKSREIKKLHNLTVDSIKYASFIQFAILPPKILFDEAFEDYFIIWEPKDIVGGDIYLFEKISEYEYVLMVIDATGHGVAGAFMTMLIKAVERQIIYNIKNKPSPSEILKRFNKNIKTILQQFGSDSTSNAGFDGGVAYINLKEKIMKFSGANVSLFYVAHGEVKTVKGDRYSVGYRQCDMDYDYKEYEISLENEAFYMTTDGYLDQNGGEKGFPFGKKRFKEIIKNNYTKPFSVQKEIFLNELKLYQRENERNDDITLIGFKGVK
jgi:serine phosphatase RsbU (regulator of sigma subunit)